MIPRIRMSAKQLYHAFRVIPNMRYRVVAFAEQRVNDQWIQMSTTELATFATTSRQNRDPRMPSRPPPPSPPVAAAAAAAAEDQVVPQRPPPAPTATAADEQVVPFSLPEQSAEPTSDAPGAIRTPRRAREARFTGQSRRRSPPPRPSSQPLRRGPPLAHAMLIPSLAVVTNDIWFTCPICTEELSHSGVACGQCGGRPACCECLIPMELSSSTQGRCPFCRYEGH
jgi:hypothetical protein